MVTDLITLERKYLAHNYPAHFLSEYCEETLHVFAAFISARCNIYISRLCYDVCVCLSVTEVHWRIIANLGFKFRSKFTAQCMRAHCGHCACREEGKGHLALC